MSRFLIELANPSDDAQLKPLAEQRIVCSSIEVYMRPEPSFLQAVRVQGPVNQVGVVRDRQTGQIVGWGSRAIRPAYINRRAANLGYLGGVWLDPKVRSGILLGRLFETLYQLHRDRQTQLYLTTIPEEAYELRQLFTSGRAGLPHYDDCGRYYALALPVRRIPPPSATSMEVIRAETAQMQQVEECLCQYGPQRQFFPCFIANDFLSGLPHLRDLRTKDFYMAMDRGQPVGVAALWNQMGFRQLVLAAYRGRRRILQTILARLWPFGNKWIGFRPGQLIPCRFVSFLAIQQDRPEVFRLLLRRLAQEAAHGGACCLLLGLHEKDPLLAQVWRYRPYVHRRRLYLVYWEDGIQFRHSLQELVPYVELATL